MPYYLVNKNEQQNGDHEVHESNNCNYLPAVQNQLSLGWHANCRDAVTEAKKHYRQSNGCYWCCNACHTG